MKKGIAILLFACILFALVSCDTLPEEVVVKAPGVDNYIQKLDTTTIAQTGITWPEGQLLPTFAPIAQQLDAVTSGPLVVGLQGLVNRTTPRILALGKPTEGATTWPDALGVPYEKISEGEVVTKYLSEIKGIVVYDNAVPDTYNLATTYAGLNDCLICNEEQAEKYSQAPYNLEVKENYVGEFTTNLEVYDYLYKNLWPQTQKRILVGVKPTDRTCIRDLAVATKSAVVWLDSTIEEERLLLGKFFADMEPGNSLYVGWWVSEPSGVAFAGGEYGIPTIAADYFENYTVYAGSDRTIIETPDPQTPKLENKVYIAFMMSEGDNIQYCEHGLRNKWDDEGRGRVPVSWTCTPMLMDAAPFMLNWYYANATEMDHLIVGPSGAGYASLDDWNVANYSWMEAFVENTDQYLRRTGFDAITVWYSINDDWGKLFHEKCKALSGLTAQSTVSATIYEDLPAISLLEDYTSENIVDSIVKSVQDEVAKWDGKTPLFIGIQGNSWNAKINHFVSVTEALGSEIYEYIRLDQMLTMYRQYYGLTYNAALYQSVEVTAAEEGYDGALAVNGSNTGKWQSSAEGTQSLTVDLGKEMYFSRYLIQHAGAGGEDRTLNTKTFSIEVSMDGKTWEKVDWVDDNTQDMTDRSIPKIITRYVRLNVSDGGADGKVRIYNFEVYASASDRFTISSTNESVIKDASRVYDDFVVAGITTPKDTYLVSGGVEVKGLLPGTHHVVLELGTLDNTPADANLLTIEIYDKKTGKLITSADVFGAQFFQSQEMRNITTEFDVADADTVVEVKVKINGQGYVKLGNISVF